MLALSLLLVACGGGGGGGGGGAAGGGTTTGGGSGATDGIVANNFFYVNAAAVDDSGDGLTASTPKKFIPSAIVLAVGGDAVLVAEGNITVTSGTTSIALLEGVSLYGGFSADFTARDPLTYTTTITDDRTANGAASAPNRVLEADALITAASFRFLFPAGK